MALVMVSDDSHDTVVWQHFLEYEHFAVKIKMTPGISPPRMIGTDASV
jgi:hypothetical protein